MKRTVLGLLAATGALTILVTFTPLTGWWSRSLAGPFDPPPAGVPLVVLGGGTWGDHILSGGSYVRAVYAFRFARDSGSREIVFCGRGVGRDMGEFVRALGVPAGFIRTEDASTSTRENALLARPMIAGRVALVTSDYHMFRAVRVFRKAGIDCVAVPVPDAVKRSTHWSLRMGVFADLAVETVKTAWYRVRGWL